MDRHTYTIYGQSLSITGILFILYQDLLMFLTNLYYGIHTMLCGAITNFKINRKHYVIIYGKKYLDDHVIFKMII